MKTKYSYYSLRFPSSIASLCHRIQAEFDATYMDLPFMLPLESELCEYRETNVIVFENREYYVASEKMDVCFKSQSHLKERLFGVINITKDDPKYVLWSVFYDEKLEGLLSGFKGSICLRKYNDPVRCCVTLKCDDV